MSAALLKRKKELKTELTQIEKQIYELETSYLEETKDFGNVFTGWEAFISSEKTKPKKAVVNEDRHFSLSSVTSPVSRKEENKKMQSSPFQEFNHANHRKREWDVTPPSSFPFPHHQSIMPPLPPIMNPNEPHWQLQQQMAQQLEENNFSHKRCRFEEPSSPFYNTAVPSNSSSLCFHQSNPPTTPSVMNHLPSTPSNSVGGTPFFPSSSYGVGVPSCGQHSPIMTHQPEQMNVGNRPASKLAQSWFTNNMTGGNQQKSSKTVSFAPEPPRQCWFCRATNGNPPGTNVMIASAKIISCSQCSKDCCQSRCIMSCDNCSSVCCTGCMMVDYSNTFERKLCYECYYVSQ